MRGCSLVKCLVGLTLCTACLTRSAAAAADDPAAPSQAQTARLRVMTFNIRYDNPGDGPDAWPHRRDHVAQLIRGNHVDLVGLQEVLHSQLVDLQQRLNGYRCYGVGRDDGKAKGEYAPIFYHAARLEMLDKSVFWLSEEPDQTGSKGWDAALPRIVTWAKFRDRITGHTLLLLNTHFDHRGRTARQESARLLVAKAIAIARTQPIVVTGDLNSLPNSDAYRNMLRPAFAPDGVAIRKLDDTRAICLTEPRGPDSTWNGFRAIVPGRRIDYVFVGNTPTTRHKTTQAKRVRRSNAADNHALPPTLKVLNYRTLDNRYAGRFPSDHLPVLVDLEWSRSPASDPGKSAQ